VEGVALPESDPARGVFAFRTAGLSLRLTALPPALGLTLPLIGLFAGVEGVAAAVAGSGAGLEA
jgi:hypothetical protein